MWTRSSIISHAIEHTFTAISADGPLALGRSGIIAAHINHLMIEVSRITSTKCLEDYLTPQTPTATKDHIESSTSCVACWVTVTLRQSCASASRSWTANRRAYYRFNATTFTCASVTYRAHRPSRVLRRSSRSDRAYARSIFPPVI